MAKAKNRPSAAKHSMGQQQAATRRGAPGRKFIGDADVQRGAAVDAERKKVARMAEIDGANRTVASIRTPVVAMLADMAQSAAHIGGLLARAPFRLARAFLRPREA